MASSQALCQSVFGCLKAMGQIHFLQGITADGGLPAFFESTEQAPSLELESSVNTLNEPRPTSIDAYFSGSHRVAVEVKFAEEEFGTCSRPRLTARDRNFERDYCNGTLTQQRGRKELLDRAEDSLLGIPASAVPLAGMRTHIPPRSPRLTSSPETYWQ
jgi:hypothetical protein